MNLSAVPPLAAAGVALALSVLRRLPPLLVSSAIETPPVRRLGLYVAAGQFVAFLLVYGLLFGVSFAVGRRRDNPRRDGRIALAAGLAAAVTTLVGTAAVLLIAEPQQGAVVVLQALGSTFGVGAQLGIVVFAGLALARYRSERPTAA